MAEKTEGRQPDPSSVRDFAESTVATKTFVTKRGKSVSFRLLKGWPDQPEGTVSVLQEQKPIGDSEEVTGTVWGQDYKSQEEAWKAIEERGYSVTE